MSALHSTKNFETGTNGTEISLKRFQEIRKLLTFRNVNSQPKTPKILGGKSIDTHFLCEIAENFGPLRKAVLFSRKSEKCYSIRH